MIVVGDEAIVGVTQVRWLLLQLDLYTAQLGCGLCLTTLCYRYTGPSVSCGTV